MECLKTGVILWPGTYLPPSVNDSQSKPRNYIFPFPKDTRPETPSMSIVQVVATAPKVALDEVIDVAAKGGIKLPDQMAADFVTLVSGLEAIIASLPDDDCVIPKPDLNKYPRTGFHVPSDNDLGGWAAKVSSSSSAALIRTIQHGAQT